MTVNNGMYNMPYLGQIILLFVIHIWECPAHPYYQLYDHVIDACGACSWRIRINLVIITGVQRLEEREPVHVLAREPIKESLDLFYLNC